MMKINKTKIQEQLIAGNTKKAIDSLLKLSNKYDKDLYDQAILLSSRYSSLARDKMLGIISNSDATISENRIKFHLTEILDNIEDAWEIA